MSEYESLRWLVVLYNLLCCVHMCMIRVLSTDKLSPVCLLCANKHYTVIYTLMVVWRSGNVVGQINKVTLRQAQLVLGWVTVYGQVNHLGM